MGNEGLSGIGSSPQTLDPSLLSGDQQTKFHQELSSIFNDLQTLVVDQSGGSKSTLKTPSSQPPGAPSIESPNTNLSMAEMVLLMGELSADTMTQSITAEQAYNNLLNQVNQQQAQNTIDQAMKAANEQAKADQKSGIAKIFGWVVAGAEILVGAALLFTGVGTALGVGLLVGAAITIAMQTDAGKEAMSDLCNAIQKALPDSFPKWAANVIVALAIAVVMIGIVLATGGAAAPAAVEAGAELEGEVGIEMTTMGVEEGLESGETAGTTLGETGETLGATAEGAAEGAGDVSTSYFSQYLEAMGQALRRMGLQAIVKMCDALAQITNQSMAIVADKAVMDAQDAMADMISAKAMFTETNQFIKMMNSTFSQQLHTLQSSISDAGSVLAEMPAVTGQIFGQA